MAKDDITLGEEMGKLEIDPAKPSRETVKEENPFIPIRKRSLLPRISQQNNKCTCPMQKRGGNKILPICKKKQNRILKEPVLRLLHMNGQSYSVSEECMQLFSNKSPSTTIGNPDNLNLGALVDNCNQLKISPDSNNQNLNASEQNNDVDWWKNDSPSVRQSKETISGPSQAGSCSQQALNPPCDVTIDELASYFETLVHIPKKMSSMAEMMYI